tara:strand:+ start:11367 stop:12065 length:699 start_codon:yes stop_codon:yes gene_type:complete
MKINDLKYLIKKEIEKKSILMAKPTLLSEANFNRIKDKIEEEKVPFIMITAFRAGRSKMKNLARQKELESFVRAAGFPWTKMPGSGYVEDSDEEENGTINVKENSILVWDEARADKERSDQDLFNLGVKLAQKYDQQSFIYGKGIGEGEEEEMLIKAFDQQGSSLKQPWAGPWQSVSVVDADDVYWSTMGSKRAKLTEMLDYYKKLPVKTKLQAMKKQYYITALKSALITLK